MKKVGFLTSNASIDNQGSDISHCNAVSYNPDSDEIVISLKRFGEIVIIDHSTTTEEARGSSGGRRDHGGDLLYRWGNPKNYGRGSNNDRVLFEQHDVKFIPKDLPGAGHLLVFNNDIPAANNLMPSIFAALMAARSPDPQIAIADIGNFSAVLELELPVDNAGSYALPGDAPYGPSEAVWSFTAPDRYSFYSPIESGAQRMPDGHTFITMGVKGELFEVSPDKQMVWQYRNPYNFNYRLPDGSPAQPGAMPYRQFRSTFYPAGYGAFKGKSLSPLNPQPEPFVFKMPPPPGQGG